MYRRRLILIAALPAALLAGAARGAALGPPPAGLQSAIFAGGSFWPLVQPFAKLAGVISVVAGYTGGIAVDPTEEQVTSGVSDHREAVRVVFDPAKIAYRRLLGVYWRNIDPFDAGGQFCDRGAQYAPAIFVADADQRQAAEASRQEMIDRFRKRLAPAILPAQTFYAADAANQDFYRTSKLRYWLYGLTCGRDSRLQAVWGSEAGDGAPRS